MTYGTWLSAAGMQANEYRQTVMANNLANVNTVGFKHDLTVFRERLVESQMSPDGFKFADPRLDALSGGTFVSPTIHSFEQGALESTENPLDLAIDGEGFFAVQVDGQMRYTRDGRFTQNEAGELVMVAGGGRARVLDEAGAPIVIPQTRGNAPLRISDNGTIRQGQAVIGKLGVVEFADRSTLRKVGANLFVSTGGGKATATNSAVRQGYVETSTANPVSGLTSMIDIARAYELNARMVSLHDNTVGQAISRVGRIG